MEKRKIIAVVGLPGSGKSEVINYLAKKYGWPKVYFGEITFDEMKDRGLPINEKNEKIIRENLREKFGKLHYAKKMVEKIERIEAPIILVESLYMWEEYLEFKEKFGEDFLTLAVYASPETRYARLQNRPKRPLASEEAWARDKAQIENLAQGGPIAMADFTVRNEKDLSSLLKSVDEAMERITKKSAS